MNTDTLGRLAQRVADQLTALHERHLSGQLTREEFVELAVPFLVAARSRAVALADLALAAELSRLWERLVNPLGIEIPEADVAGALADTLDSDQYRLDQLAAIAVLARAVTLWAAQDATHEAMVAHDVSVWVRDTNGGACELCLDLAGQGEAPITVKMHQHKGCGCAQRPVA